MTGATLTLPYASLNLDIKSLLGGGIREQLRPKVIPILDDVKAMAEGNAMTDTNDPKNVPPGNLWLLRFTLPFLGFPAFWPE